MLQQKTFENLELTENEVELNNNFTEKPPCKLLLALTFFQF